MPLNRDSCPRQAVTRCRTGMKWKTIVNFVQRRKQIDKNKPTFFSFINYLIMLMTLKFCASTFNFFCCFVFRYILNDFILFTQGLSIYFESAGFLSLNKKKFYFAGFFATFLMLRKEISFICRLFIKIESFTLEALKNCMPVIIILLLTYYERRNHYLDSIININYRTWIY